MSMQTLTGNYIALMASTQSISLKGPHTTKGRRDSDTLQGGCSEDKIMHLVEECRVLAYCSAAQQDKMSSDIILLKILVSLLAKHGLDKLEQSNMSLM
jgi:hypothetical protein